MRGSHLSWFICPDCGSSELELLPYEAKEDDVCEGCVRCKDCGVWYRIHNGVLDLLPVRLRRMDLYAAFAVKHGLRLGDTSDASLSPDAGISEQIDFFKEDADEYEKTVVNSPYYKALDRIAFLDWMGRFLKPYELVLDLGCGTGRQSIPFAEHGLTSCAIDISEEMLQLARQKASRLGLAEKIDLVVADAHNPPVKDGIFTACIIYGTLHHLPRPDLAIRNASKKLATGGRFYTLDPHNSPVRFMFDWAMKVWRLYDEKASDAPLLTTEMLERWLLEAGLRSTVRLSTYLPPHLFALLPAGARAMVLQATDTLLFRIPGIRSWGGVIISEGAKIT